MSWLDRVTDALGLGGNSRARQYARAGGAFGPLGMAGGYLLGRWMDGRATDQAHDAQMANLDRFGSRLDDAIWGPGGGGSPLLSSGQPTGDGTGGVPAWFDDTTMSADDPLGLVPDYGQDGMDADGDGRITHGERMDALRGGYGGKFAGTPFQGTVTNMMVGGAPVILGAGDPNGRYRNRGTDYGG